MVYPGCLISLTYVILDSVFSAESDSVGRIESGFQGKEMWVIQVLARNDFRSYVLKTHNSVPWSQIKFCQRDSIQHIETDELWEKPLILWNTESLYFFPVPVEYYHVDSFTFNEYIFLSRKCVGYWRNSRYCCRYSVVSLDITHNMQYQVLLLKCH